MPPIIDRGHAASLSEADVGGPALIMHEYKEHFVAFLDILGFKSMINHSSCSEIYGIFSEIHKRSKASMNYAGVPIHAYEHIHHKILSDSVIVFIDASIEDSFPALLDICARLQISLADREHPILLRGGIAKGSLYYEDDIIYGEGLTNAYLLEANLAKYPRVIFTGDTLAQGQQITKYMFPDVMRAGFTLNFIADDDMLFMIDYFPHRTAWSVEKMKQYWDRLLLLSETMLNKATEASLREKYIWLKKYIAKSIERVVNMKEIYQREQAERHEQDVQEYNARFSIYEEAKKHHP